MKNSNQVVNTSFKGVERLLNQMAHKGFSRLRRAGIMGADFDDVLGELQLGYVKALNGFKPESGNQFTTYCVRVCWNEFNKYVERLEREHSSTGMMSVEDLHNGDESAYDDPMEMFSNERLRSSEDESESRQLLSRASKSLSKESKGMLLALMDPNPKMLKAYNDSVQDFLFTIQDDPKRLVKSDDISINFIGKYLNIDKGTIKEIKKELGRVYGIPEWNKGNAVPTHR